MLSVLLYKRDGTPYPRGEKGVLAWCRDLEQERNRVVMQEHCPDGSMVSTVWIGIDRNYSAIVRGQPHQPLIFETMVFDKDGEAVERKLWHSEDEAIVGHLDVLDKHLHPDKSRDQSKRRDL